MNDLLVGCGVCVAANGARALNAQRALAHISEEWPHVPDSLLTRAVRDSIAGSSGGVEKTKTGDRPYAGHFG